MKNRKYDLVAFMMAFVTLHAKVYLREVKVNQVPTCLTFYIPLRGRLDSSDIETIPYCIDNVVFVIFTLRARECLYYVIESCICCSGHMYIIPQAMLTALIEGFSNQ